MPVQTFFFFPVFPRQYRRRRLVRPFLRQCGSFIRHLVAHRWPFRLHATYDETITRALNVYEAVNREMPLAGSHWFFDHCETVSNRNLERIKALGGSIAVQDRMAFQGAHYQRPYAVIVLLSGITFLVGRLSGTTVCCCISMARLS